MLHGAQTVHAVDDETSCADAVDLRTHAHQHRADVDNLRFFGSVVNDGAPICQNCRHHKVLCRSDRRKGQGDISTVQTVRRLGNKIAVIKMNIRTQSPETRCVQIKTARPNGIPTGKCNLGAAHTADQRAQNRNRGAHRTHKLIISLNIRALRDVNGDDASPGIVINIAAEPLKETGHDRNVENRRNVRDDRTAGSKQSGGHEFEDTVLGTADFYRAFQANRAVDAEDFHQLNLPTAMLSPGGDDSIHADRADSESASRASLQMRGSGFPLLIVKVAI